MISTILLGIAFGLAITGLVLVVVALTNTSQLRFPKNKVILLGIACIIMGILFFFARKL